MSKGLQAMERGGWSGMRRRRSMARWAIALGVVLLFVAGLGLGRAQAQQGQDEGGVAFAGGQMVRGVVTAVGADRLTVKTEAGEVYQVALSANTRLSRDRQPLKVADIKVGDGVGAMGVLDAPTKTVHAVFVGVMDAEQVKKAREGMGKVYITGKVTAIDMDGLKLTVLRPDGVSQVIGVDEGTSFKRGGRGMPAMVSGSGVVDAPAADSRGGAAGSGNGGESITFADVKVGDGVAGRGGLKNGTFVPTELGVMDAAAMAQRRRRREGAGSGAAAPSGTTAPPMGAGGVPQ
jgi:hypothetical protein